MMFDQINGQSEYYFKKNLVGFETIWHETINRAMLNYTASVAPYGNVSSQNGSKLYHDFLLHHQRSWLNKIGQRNEIWIMWAN